LNTETISEQEKRTAERNFDDYDTETFNFLKPFSAMFEQETQSSYSPFTQQAQVKDSIYFGLNRSDVFSFCLKSM